MPLNNANLTTALQNILNGTTATPTAVAAGNAWGDAYDAYAKTGVAGGGGPTVPGSATTALRAALGSQFAVVPGTASGAASGIVSALNAYWPQVTFAGMTAPPAPGGGAALQSALTTIFSTLGGSHASKASDLVSVLQAYTNAVIVTYPGPSTFPVT